MESDNPKTTQEGGAEIGNEKSAPWRSALALGMVVVLGTALLAGVNNLTRDRILEQERRVVLEQLGQVLGPGRYDNALHQDVYTFRDETAFPQGQTVTVYRARKQGRPVAVILRFAAMDGYNGRIGLLVGIDTQGRLTGVRVTSHKETPGLGDGIEIERSNWILDFDGKSLENPAPEQWAVRRDQGYFDQMTGATITPRAIVNAVKRALIYFDAHADELFTAPTQAEPEASS